MEHPFDLVELSPRAPKAPQGLENIWKLDQVYTLVLLACLLELVLLVALLPRDDSSSVVAFGSVAALRALAIFGLVMLVLPYKTQVVFLPMLVWSTMLAAPELWAFALEGRVGFPLSFVGTPLLMLGIHAAFRLFSRLGLIWIAVVAATIFFVSWNIQTDSTNPGVIMLLIVSSFMLGLSYWRKS